MMMGTYGSALWIGIEHIALEGAGFGLDDEFDALLMYRMLNRIKEDELRPRGSLLNGDLAKAGGLHLSRLGQWPGPCGVQQKA